MKPSSVPFDELEGGPAFSGHGTWDPENGFTQVPEGTYLRAHTPHGGELSLKAAQKIESGGAPLASGQYVYGPGDVVPNYILHPQPSGWGVSPRLVEVPHPTSLSELLQPNQGLCEWSACRVVVR
jgi:hypothetical protein